MILDYTVQDYQNYPHIPQLSFSFVDMLKKFTKITRLEIHLDECSTPISTDSMQRVVEKVAQDYYSIQSITTVRIECGERARGGHCPICMSRCWCYCGSCSSFKRCNNRGVHDAQSCDECQRMETRKKVWYEKVAADDNVFQESINRILADQGQEAIKGS